MSGVRPDRFVMSGHARSRFYVLAPARTVGFMCVYVSTKAFVGFV